MTSTFLSHLAILTGLIVVRMVLSGSFSALINARKGILKERADRGQPSAKRALALSENSTQLLAAQQFVLTLLNLILVALIALYFWVDIERGLKNLGLNDLTAHAAVYFILLPGLTVLLIIVDRLTAALVAGRAEPVAIFTSRLMNLIVQALSPLVLLILRISGRTAVLIGGSDMTHLVTEEEIKTLVDAGSEEGVLEDEEKEMIYSVMRFGDTVAREVMVPRIDIVALSVEATLEEALDIIISAGHSRIPMYRGTIDEIEGVLYAKDLLKVWRNGEKPTSLQSLLREPHFVPETKSASELLLELQVRKTHLVFVVDEYGGTAGLVTIEDLIEEIVGEIQDEYDVNEEAQYEKISDDEYIFNARIDLDDFNELLDASIPTDESDTLGGYVFSELGRVPTVNDHFVAHSLEFRVVSVNGRRIRQVSVKRIPEATLEETLAATSTETEPGRSANTPVTADTLSDTASLGS